MRGRNVFYPDRLGRQRPGHRAPGAELLRRPLRPVAAATTPTSRRRAEATCPKDHRGARSAGPTSSTCASELTADDEEAFEELFRRLGLSRRLVATSTPPSTTRSRRVSQLAFLRNLARGEAYQQRRARRCGTSTTAPPSPRPSWRTASVPGRLPHARRSTATDGDVLHRHDPARAARRAASRSSPTPTTSATSRCSARRCARRCSTSRCRCVAHQLADPEKGTGIAMICTFGDTTDVTWWRELDLPTRARHRPRRPLRSTADAGRGSPPTTAAAHYAELAGKTVKQAQARDRRAARASRASCSASPRPITHPVKFYERGDRPARDRHQPPVVHPQRRPRRRSCATRSSTRGQELRWHPDYMRHRYENWVEGLNGDWLISRQRFFGVPIPLWYPLDADGEVDHDHPIAARRGDAAGRPVDRRAAGLHRRPARQARRLRRRPRRHGHVGDVVAHPADRRRVGRRRPTCSPGCSRWTCAPRPTTSSARGCSPPSCAPHYEHGSLPWADAR